MIFGILTALFTFLRHNGPVFLEEPESYLHPKAIIDLLEVLRELSDDTTVLISTHSPVLLNELRPEEVTVMEETAESGYFTTKDVKDISEAIAVLKRGYITMGELLQSNFAPETN
jgi:predicted ATPase